MLLSLVFGSITLPSVMLIRHKRSLLDQAVCVATLHMQNDAPPGLSLDHFYWISNYEVLCLRNTSDPQNPWDLTRLNVRSSREMPLPALTHLINATSDPYAQELKVSPSGKWVLWSANNSKTIPQCLTMSACVDGSQAMTWKDGPVGEIRWMGEQDRWIAMIMDVGQGGLAYGIVHDLSHSNVHQHLPLTKYSVHDLLHGTIVADATLLSDTWTGINRNNSEGNIKAISLTDGHTVKEYRIQLPANTSFKKIAYSLRGDKLAWLLETRFPHALPLWKTSIFSFLGFPQSEQSIWISRQDGTGMHKIGGIAKSAKATSQNNISELQWLSDARHISFVYCGHLWLIPAP